MEREDIEIINTIERTSISNQFSSFLLNIDL